MERAASLGVESCSSLDAGCTRHGHRRSMDFTSVSARGLSIPRSFRADFVPWPIWRTATASGSDCGSSPNAWRDRSSANRTCRRKNGWRHGRTMDGTGASRSSFVWRPTRHASGSSNRIVQVLDDVRPGLSRSGDNNFWINCNREGHSHRAGKRQLRACRRAVRDARRAAAALSDMLIENVSGGGNRLDYGMLAFSDVGWMDDRTAPSSLVRHNIEGLTLAFPPGITCSRSWIDSEQEPISDTDNFAHIARRPDAGNSRAHLRVSGPGCAIERQPAARDRDSTSRCATSSRRPTPCCSGLRRS